MCTKQMFTTILFVFVGLSFFNSSEANDEFSKDEIVGLSDQAYSAAEMVEMGKEIIATQYRFDDYRILHEDYSPGGNYYEPKKNMSQLIRFRNFLTVQEQHRDYWPLRFETDSTLSLPGTLTVLSGHAPGQNINASIFPRTKSIAIDNQGRFYFLHGFEVVHAENLFANLLASPDDIEMFIRLTKIYLRRVMFVRPITAEYKANNGHLVKRFGEMSIKQSQKDNLLEVEMYGDKFIANLMNEPIRSTVIKFHFRFSPESGFEISSDTLGVISYEDD